MKKICFYTDHRNFKLEKSNLSHSLVYRQLRESNSQWHKKNCKKYKLGEVPIGWSASWKKCQLGKVPVGGNFSRRFFRWWKFDFFFVTLNKMFENIKKTSFYENIWYFTLNYVDIKVIEMRFEFIICYLLKYINVT